MKIRKTRVLLSAWQPAGSAPIITGLQRLHEIFTAECPWLLKTEKEGQAHAFHRNLFSNALGITEEEYDESWFEHRLYREDHA